MNAKTIDREHRQLGGSFGLSSLKPQVCEALIGLFLAGAAMQTEAQSDSSQRAAIGRDNPASEVSASASGLRANFLDGPPIIQVAPTDQGASTGSAVDFTVQADGSPPLAYQWFFQSTRILGGETNPVLHVSPVVALRAGPYTVVITNVFGAVTSPPAILTVLSGQPAIQLQPRSRTIAVGDTVEFSATASGTLPLSYQWFYNSTRALDGASNSCLRLTNAQTDQSGTYAVVVTNALGSATSSPAVLSVVSPSVVTTPTEAALRTALAPGGKVTFDCDGIITLNNSITILSDTVLDGAGHQITLSGGGTARVFLVTTNLVFTLANCTIANGLSTNGGGLYNDGGTVQLLNACFQSNIAKAELWLPTSNLMARGGGGGGLYNRAGTICATNCAFLNNTAQQASTFDSVEWPMPYPTTPCVGGAIDNEGGLLNLHNCQFSDNSTCGGAGNYWRANGSTVGAYGGRSGYGGAIYNTGVLNSDLCTYLRNTATGGAAPPLNLQNTSYPGNGCSGASGGSAAGGGIYNTGTLTLLSCLLASNSASGSPAAAGGSGASGSSYPIFVSNGGDGGTGGDACGGPVFNSGTARLFNCTIAWNVGIGGNGGSGGNGGRWISPPVEALGGNGGNGGRGQGGVYSATVLFNCTVAFNTGIGGAGGLPGSPPSNAGRPGFSGGTGGAVDGQTLLANTLLATNAPTNCTGTGTDAGHNLSSDAASGLTNSSSRKTIDPKLGPLMNNGGPTLTLMPQPDSPAIDAADRSIGPTVDQRGYARNFGSGPDIGAVEYWPPVPFLTISHLRPDAVIVRAAIGYPGQSCRLLQSGNLLDWLPWATNAADTNGMVVFTDTPGQRRFYRALVP